MTIRLRDDQEWPVPGESIFMRVDAAGNAVVYQAGRDLYLTSGGRQPLLSGPAGGVECPYPGLQAFGPDQAQWFFGRGKLTNDLLTLAKTRYTAGRMAFVVAASGAGKSSLLKAGLLPAIAGRRLPQAGSDQWPQLVLTPTADPLKVIAEGIDRLASTEEETTEEESAEAREADHERPAARALVTRLEQALRTRAAAAAAASPAARNGSPGRGGRLGVVIIVDQFEELFTLCGVQSQQRAFIEWLRLVAAGTASCKALVVCGLRTAYYARCTDFPDLVEALQAAQLIVRSMSTEELKEAIRGPAEAVGLKVEPELVAELVLDLGRTSARPETERDGGNETGLRPEDASSEIPEDAGRLPLLAHALQVTWQARSAETLTLAAYKQAGGIAGAIEKTADQAYATLTPEARDQARRVFLRLVKIGVADDSRRPLSRSDLSRLDDAAAQVITAYVGWDCRLLTETASSCQITHEALLYAWPKLRRWIEQDRAGKLIRQELEESASAWEREQKDPSLLQRGTRLVSAQEWKSDPANSALLTDLASEYLATSGKAARQAMRVRRVAVIVLSVLALVASGAAAFAFRERAVETTQRQAAVSQARLAQSEAFATASTNVLATNVPLAMLLSLQGYRRDHTLQAANALIQAAQQPLRTVLNAGYEVNAVAYLPSGTLAVADNGKRIELWDPATGKRTGVLDEGSSAGDLAVSPDGKWLAAADDSHHIGLWRLATRTRVGSLDEHSEVETVAFSPDSTMIAGGDDSGHVGIWDVATRRQVATYTARNQTTIAQDKAIFDVAFSPRGDLLAAGQLGGRVDLWDLATKKRVATLDDDALIYSITFSPDGKTLATADNKGYIRLYTSRTHKVGKVLIQGGNGAYGLRFSPDGRFLAIGDTMGGIGLWNVATGKRMATLAQGRGIADLAFSSDGKTISAGDYTGHIDVWNAAPNLRSARVARGVPVGGVAFSPDGKYIAASGSFSGSVRVWAVATGRQRLAFNVHTGALGISFSPDGRWLAVGAATGQIDLARLTATGAVAATGTLKQSNEAFSLAFSPDSRILATGDHFGGIDLWNMATGSLIRTLHAKEQVDSIAFSPDGSLIASGDESKYLRIWNVSTGAKIAAIKQGGVVDGVAFSPDGKVLAVGNASGYTGLWNVATRKRLALLVQRAAVNSISFSPNGSTLAVADATGLVRLWNVRTRQTFADLPVAGPGGSVYTLKFSPNGQILAAGDGSGNVDLLRLNLGPLTPGYFTRSICGRVRSNMTRAQWALYAPGQRYSKTCPGYR